MRYNGMSTFLWKLFFPHIFSEWTVFLFLAAEAEWSGMTVQEVVQCPIQSGKGSCGYFSEEVSIMYCTAHMKCPPFTFPLCIFITSLCTQWVMRPIPSCSVQVPWLTGHLPCEALITESPCRATAAMKEAVLSHERITKALIKVQLRKMWLMISLRQPSLCYQTKRPHSQALGLGTAFAVHAARFFWELAPWYGGSIQRYLTPLAPLESLSGTIASGFQSPSCGIYRATEVVKKLLARKDLGEMGDPLRCWSLWTLFGSQVCHTPSLVNLRF